MKTKLSKILQTNKAVKFAYLFGSYAEDTQTQRSDIDIAVYLNNTSLDARLALHHQLEKLLQKDVDIVVLNETKNMYLLENIFRNGIVVTEDESRALFEVQKQHEIIDFKNFRRYIDAA